MASEQPSAERPTLAARFEAERVELTQDVVRAVAGEYSPNCLAQLLNETAQHELARLMRGDGDRDTPERIARWRALIREIAGAPPQQLQRHFEAQLHSMVGDVEGSFNPRVYWAVRHLVPTAISMVIAPRATVRDLVRRDRKLPTVVDIRGHAAPLAELARVGSLVYLPTHSSNLDSVVLGEALIRQNLPPVLYGAGKNMFDNPIMGYFLHNLGAYRVDRRVCAPLYRAVLKQYSTQLLLRGHHSLFYPGGTRSRSNMVERRLKLGLIGSCLDAVLRSHMRGRARRVFMVPVTVNYELVMEAESLMRDHLLRSGRERYMPGPRDESSRLRSWWQFLNRLPGRSRACVLRFGRAMDPFGNPVDTAGRSLDPSGRVIDAAGYLKVQGDFVRDSRRDIAYVRNFGRALVDALHRDTVVMTTQLVALAAFRIWLRMQPGVEFYARMRGDGLVELPQVEVYGELERLRARALQLEADGEVCVCDGLRTPDVAGIVTSALRRWSEYHRGGVLRAREGILAVTNAPLLAFYQNRLVPWARLLGDGTGVDDAIAALGDEVPWRR